MPARRRSAQLGTLLATFLLVAGCGASEPEPLEAMDPEVPADLCATVPEATKQGLIANSNTDETGNPTAACSLRSADGAPTEVRAVVTWLQASDEESADDIWDSQCRAIDRAAFRDVAGFAPADADEGCAASGRVNGAESTTMAAVSGREVVTVRLSSEPPEATVTDRAQKMLEGVLGSLAGGS